MFAFFALATAEGLAALAVEGVVPVAEVTDVRRSERDLLLSGAFDDEADTADDGGLFAELELPAQRRSYHRARRQSMDFPDDLPESDDDEIPYDMEDNYDGLMPEDLDMDSDDDMDEFFDEDEGPFRRGELVAESEPKRRIFMFTVARFGYFMMKRYARRTGVQMACNQSAHCRKWKAQVEGVVRRACGSVTVCGRAWNYVMSRYRQANAWVERWAATECNRSWTCRRIRSHAQKVAADAAKAAKNVANTAAKTGKNVVKSVTKTFSKWGRRRAEVAGPMEEDSPVSQRLAARRVARDQQ